MIIAMIKKMLTILLVAVCVGLILASPKILHAQIEKKLADYFVGSEISIGLLGLEKPLAVSLSEIHIKNKTYSIDLKKILLTSEFKLILTEPSLKFDGVPQLGQASSSPDSAQKNPAAWIRSLEIRGLTAQYQLADFKADLKGDLAYDLQRGAVSYAKLSSGMLTKGAIQLKGLTLEVTSSGAGMVSAEKLSVNKLKLENIQGSLFLEGSFLKIDPVSASLLKGMISGRMSVLLESPYSYEGEWAVDLLDLQTFIQDFEFEKKMSADGKLVGKITVKGDLSGLQELSGSLKAPKEGGDLVIEDKEFLNYLAKNVHQPIELVEAGFKEYHYDTGEITLSMDQKDLGLLVDLNGPKGKRNFQIRLHDLL